MGDGIEFIGQPTALLWGAAFFGLGAVVLVFHRRELLGRLGRTRAGLGVAGSAALAILSVVLYGASQYPRASLTKAEMSCSSWAGPVPWGYFSGIDMVRGGKFPTLAEFHLKPEFIDAVTWRERAGTGRTLLCRIDGLDRSSDEALGIMRSYWNAATGQAF